MQSLKARFNGNSMEVVKYAREYGVMAAMQEYEVKDFVAMLTFCQEQSPGEEFQAVKTGCDDFSKPDAFDKLLEAMLRKYAQMELANKNLAGENTELKKQLDYFKAGRWQQARPLVQGVMDYCKK